MSVETELNPSEVSELLIADRAEIFALVQNIYDKSKTLKPENVKFFVSQFERLKELESKFQSIHDKIKMFNVKQKDPKLKIEVLKQMISFTEIIDATRSKYLSVCQSCDVNSDIKPLPVNETKSDRVNCPVIKLPTFSGELDEWDEFNSLFSSLVDRDPNFSDSTKFHYLRLSLKGDALSVISDFPLIPQNYHLAYSALKARYQNVRRLASSYLNKITNFPKRKDNSLPNLKLFLKAHSHIIRSLEALGIENIGDLIILHVALSNLDNRTYKDFESQNPSDSIPTFDSLIKFVVEKVRVAEMISNNNKQIKDNGGDVSASQNKNKKRVTCAAISKEVVNENESSLLTQTEVKSNFEKSNKLINKVVPSRDSTTTPTLKCWNCDGSHVYSKCSKPRKKFCYRCGAKDEVISSCPHCNSLNSKARSNAGSP